MATRGQFLGRNCPSPCLLPRAASHAAFKDHAVRGEAGDFFNGVSDLSLRHLRVELDVEHSNEDLVDLQRDGKDGGEEVHRIA